MNFHNNEDKKKNLNAPREKRTRIRIAWISHQHHWNLDYGGAMLSNYKGN